MASEDDLSELEQAFIASWDGVEQATERLRDAFPNKSWPARKLSFIAELRRRGYDHQFRAGQQIGMLVLSRSRIHGLRLGQPRLTFNLRNRDGMTVSYYKSADEFVQLEIEHDEITLEVEEALDWLLAHPID